MKQAKPRKIWRIVLVTSLAVNLLMVGIVGGAVLRDGGGPPRGFDVQLGALTSALTSADRRAIGEHLRQGDEKPGQSRQERRAAFESIVHTLEMQPFDPEALAGVFRDQQKQQSMLQERALEAFVSHITEMSSDERTALAERLRERVSQRNGQDERRPPPPEGRNSGG